MAEYPGEGEPIPFLKFYGEAVVAPQPTVHVREDVFLAIEIINMGTAPSRPGDQVTGYLVYSGSSIHQETVDIPPIDPNGATWRWVFHFEGRFVMVEGEWMLGAMITNEGTIGEVQDDIRVTFQVSPAETEG